MVKALIFCFLLAFGACGRQKAPIAPAGPAAAQNPSGSTASEGSQADLSKTLDRLTQAVRRYAAEMRAVPKSLDELVVAGYLPEIPGAPPGKKFVIDDQLRVTLK